MIKQTFVGVYRSPSRPNQRLPIYQVGGRFFDLIGNEVDLNKMVKVVD